MLAVCCALALLLAYTDLLWRLDLVLYDWELRLWSRPAPADVIIVAVDERSLDALGRWPWSRRLHASLLDRLTESGARTIGVDLVLAEPDTADPGADVSLAEAMQRHGRVVLPVLLEQTSAAGQLLETLPLPDFVGAAAGLGHVDVELDADGIARTVYLKAGLGSPRWPTFGLAMLEVDGRHPISSLPGERNPRPDASSPYVWVRDHRMLVPFAGPGGHFRQVSYVDVLRGDYTPGAFQGSLMLVGATASGLGDTLPTPVSGQHQPLSGVEFNANVLDALREGVAIVPLDPSWRLPLTGVVAVLSIALFVIAPARQAPLMAALSGLLVAIVGWVGLRAAHIWFPPAAVLATLVIGYAVWVSRGMRRLLGSLIRERQRAEATLQAVGDAVIETDRRGIIRYANAAAKRLTGLREREAIGRPLSGILAVADGPNGAPLPDPVLQCVSTGQVIALRDSDLRLRLADKREPLRGVAAPLRAESGKITGVVLALAATGGARRIETQLTDPASYDGLTGLSNRTRLRQLLQHEMVRAVEHGQELALLHVDLDRFKAPNDGLGHPAGDALLQAVAERLAGCSSRPDGLARIGADEFAVVFGDCSGVSTAAELAERVRVALERPYRIQGRDIVVTASVGVALFPDDGRDADALVRNAGIASYQAKHRGGNSVSLFASDMGRRARERLLLEQELRGALARGELEVYYQPQVNLGDGRIVGAEALLRWRHPSRGLLLPSEFISLAEQSDLIDALGDWVLQAACRQAKAWDEAGFSPLRIAVNLSPQQLLKADLPERVARVLEQTSLEARRLGLELTESTLVKDMEAGLTALQALKSMGVQLAIDDFGTGYSSLGYLMRFPFDQVKIDRSFVTSMEVGQGNAAIAMAIIAMAHSLDLAVVAEGVETRSQVAVLQANRCDEAQGYYVSRPLPPGQLTDLLSGGAVVPLA